MIFLLDVLPEPTITTTGAGIAAAFALIFFGAVALAAYIAFRAMKRTVKMAVRLVIVGVILIIAISGSIFLYFYTQTPVQRERPVPQRKR